MTFQDRSLANLLALNPSRLPWLLIGALFASSPSLAQDPELFAQIQPMSPEDSLASMVVQDGYYMELAAAEPMIEEPVLFTFDGDGRLYVAEMLTYMQDADGSDKFEPVSRIKRLEDLDNDGVFDSFTVFANGLLLPRMIQTLDDGRILVRETNTFDLLLLEDTDGDGVADSRETVYVGGDRGGNLEHQPNGLIWGIDNWLYVTYTDRRYRWQDGRIISEPMAYGGGQWGLTQDHLGRLYYSTAGGQNPAFTFQFPSVYGRVAVEGEQADGFREVFPLDQTPDVQGGLPLLRDDNTLNHFTGGGGQSIYLGDQFPDMVGDYIITEPVGNLIRRAKVIREDGFTTLVHPYQDQRTEFIATTDANFRPVWSGTAPDGSLLILDMYRGIIQEGNWTRPGSYLRGVIDEYGFDKIIGRGRLFRVLNDEFTPREAPRLLSLSAAELVPYLAHSNQWWRLEAQKLLVLKQDQSVIPALKAMAASHSEPLAKVHALWTLDGLGEVDRELLLDLMQEDLESDVRVTALRISESLVKLGDAQIEDLWRSLASDSDIEVAQQAVLSAYYVLSERRQEILASVQATHGDKKGLVAIAESMNNLEAVALRRESLEAGDAAMAEAILDGQSSYRSLCYTCHGEDGAGTPAGNALLAPSLHNNPRVTGNASQLISLVLHGMTGEVDGVSYASGQMQSIASNGASWIANVLTYIRNDFGNQASAISQSQVEAIQDRFSTREQMWTQQELQARFATELSNKDLWQVSTNMETPERQPLRRLIDGSNENAVWRSGSARQAGDSITVELPRAASLSEVVIDSSGLNNDYSRGYQIEFSLDGENWKQVLDNPAATDYDRNQTLADTARFVRIVNQVGGTTRRWGIREISFVGAYLN